MKYLLSCFCLILSACGSTNSGGGNPGTTGGGSGSSLHTYTLVIQGDGAAFVGQIFTDTEQVNTAPQLVPNGQTVTLQATGNSASNILVQRTNTNGTPLVATLYIDGAQIAVSSPLNVSGEYQDFGAH